MKKYFRTIGIIELFCSLLGIIFYIIAMVKTIDSARGDGFLIFTSVFILIILLFFTPAIGLLFLWAGTTTDFKPKLEAKAVEVKQKKKVLEAKKALEVVQTKIRDEEKKKKIEESENEGNVVILEDTKVSEFDPTIIPKGKKGFISSESETTYSVRFRMNGKMYLVDVLKTKVEKII